MLAENMFYYIKKTIRMMISLAVAKNIPGMWLNFKKTIRKLVKKEAKLQSVKLFWELGHSQDILW
jgi:hypothetical protein